MMHTMQTQKWYSLLLILVFACGLLIALPHLMDEVWQDEAYTLIHFSGKGALHPFTDYHLPNNHILFSSLVSLFWNWGDPLWHIRLTPFIIFALSLAVFATASVRLGGLPVGILSLFLFAFSSVTENFALQMRGYGLSWLLFAIILISLPLYTQYGHKRWAFCYVSASAASVLTLPTNLFLCAVPIGWCAVVALTLNRPLRDKIIRLVVIAIAPLFGLIGYGAVWPQLLSNSRRAFSNWESLELLRHVFISIYVEFWWLLPFAVAGFLFLTADSLEDKSFRIGSPRNHLLLIICLVVIIPVWIVAMPTKPFPRNLLPLVPFGYYTFGVLCVAAWERIFPQLNNRRVITFVLLILASIGYRAMGHAFPYRGHANAKGNDLIYQHYHDDFSPSQTINLLSKFPKDLKRLVVTDYEAYYTLSFALINSLRMDTGINILHYMSWPEVAPKANLGHPPMIVVKDTENLKKILETTGSTRVPYRKVEKFGIFNIYVGLDGGKTDEIKISRKPF